MVIDVHLVVIDVIFRLRSLHVELVPVGLLFGLHLLVHLLLHHELLLLDLVHLVDKLSFPLGVPDAFLCALLLLVQFDQTRLKRNLLVSHHLQVVLGLHHLGLGTLSSHRAHTCHQHLSVESWFLREAEIGLC